MSYLLRAEGIGKRFGRREVLKAASVWAEPGKITTLMGRNGAGKTTLLRIAAGTLRADYGVVHFEGLVSERPRLHDLARRGLFFVPQAQLLSRAHTVEEHLQAVAWRFGSAGLEEAVERTGIRANLGQRVWELSGGERMRASLALVLVRRPVCLLIDEPLARVAPRDQEILSRALRAMADDGVAVVTSGHDASALLSLSDAIIWCVAGTTHPLGSPEAARSHAQFVREYLGPGAG